MTRGSAAALLLLADGRFPAGGYAHSGGLEPAVESGRVRDVATLTSFLQGRAVTAGAMAAAFAAAACGAFADEDVARLQALDTELDARMPSPALRSTSRQLGRQFLRVANTIQPHPRLAELGTVPHQPIALGAASAAFELGRHEAALAALHESVAGPAAAAVRLLAVDPFSVHTVLARLGSLLDDLAGASVRLSDAVPEDLPAPASPLLDICAEEHAARDTRLFAS